MILNRIKRKILEILFWGQRYQCPICEGRFRAWKLCGVIHKRKEKCWGCGSLARQRLLYLFLKNKEELFEKRLSVLHIAPEPCLMKIFLKYSNLKYVTADLSSPWVDLHVDITHMKMISDGTYDVVLCSHVLEHISDDLKAMKEIRRVLKANGWAILQVPLSQGLTFEDPAHLSADDRLKYYGQADHVRRYGEDDYKTRLESAGFEVDKIDFARTFIMEKCNFYGINFHEDIYLCRRGDSRDGH